eukprot:3965362-Lingulodinium_polyedra.AAC.1
MHIRIRKHARLSPADVGIEDIEAFVLGVQDSEELVSSVLQFPPPGSTAKGAVAQVCRQLRLQDGMPQ